MEAFDVDSVPQKPARDMVRVKSFCILMCLKKHIPLSCGAVTSLCEELEEDPDTGSFQGPVRSVQGRPGQLEESLGFCLYFFVTAEAPSGRWPSRSISAPSVSRAGLTTASFWEQSCPRIRSWWSSSYGACAGNPHSRTWLRAASGARLLRSECRFCSD